MPLDTATMALLRASAAVPDNVPMHLLSPDQARKALASRTAAYAEGPNLHATENLELGRGDGAKIRVRIHRPCPNPKSVVVYFHGGGWVIGDIEAFDSVSRHLAEASGAAVVLIEYRKAPEYPFPIPLEDAWAGLNWVSENIESIAVPGAQLYVAGDSAGANLATVVARRATEQRAFRLAGQLLIYPVVDHDLERDSYRAPENQTLLTRETMEYFWGHYAPDPEIRAEAELSPLRHEAPEGLAPALVVTAEHDVLRDEGDAYAAVLRESAVDVEHHCWPGQMHGFFQMVGILPASLEVVNLLAERIRKDEKKLQGA